MAHRGEHELQPLLEGRHWRPNQDQLESIDEWSNKVHRFLTAWRTVERLAIAANGVLAAASVTTGAQAFSVFIGILESATWAPFFALASSGTSALLAQSAKHQLAQNFSHRAIKLTSEAQELRNLIPQLEEALHPERSQTQVAEFELAVKGFKKELASLDSLIREAEKFGRAVQVESSQIASLGQQRRYGFTDAEFKRRMTAAGMLLKHEW